MTITCSYCKYFPASKIIRREAGNPIVKQCSENTDYEDPLFEKSTKSEFSWTPACAGVTFSAFDRLIVYSNVVRNTSAGVLRGL